ncbi:3-hydroxyacyl-CoA dehydrogenase NAD-binding domain-containing protein [Ectopseudomonas mendocina]|uniref:3-hydroxyacyl-CoA dehydrogenase NAD-binding domain-containing protein n=1 Tax=Ectopseudomonas mendocina TaxID=300 RepID=A0ABZ2RL67_ECTME
MSVHDHAAASAYSPARVDVTLDGAIAVLEIVNPPVNALSAVVKQGIADALDTVERNTAVEAIILHGAGKHFCGGADIREFGQVVGPNLSELCNRLENSRKPVIAAIKGSCLGGGLELALASHFRVATASAKLGLPEVNLGLLPGAGGTQRLPRLVGAGVALELMLSGRPVTADQPLASGLVDKVCSNEELLQSALIYAQQLVSSGQPVRKTRDAQALADAATARVEIEQVRQTKLKNKGLFSPEKIVEAVQAALDLPFDEGLKTERELFNKCIESPQRSALVHAFLAEKASSKVPEASQASPAALKKIAVIGAGTMGVGISVALLDAGYDVLLMERGQTFLERGRNAIANTYQKLQDRQRISGSEKDIRLSRLSCHIDFAVLADTDMVIEAVFEDMAVKKALLAQLDQFCRADTILVTNTSYLDINEMSQGLSNPGRVIGIHFFSPANIMKLVEVVVPENANSRTVATAFSLAKSLKKTPVRAGMCDGFIGNRMLAVYREAAELMMLDGASPYQIDEAIREFGFPMGPFQVVDLAGGDISWATRKRKAPLRDPRLRYVSVADKLCEQGWFGQKTGMGYYVYEKGAKAGRVNPELDGILREVRAEAGILPKAFSNREIIERYLAAMINEGANVVQEGIALRPSDVDVTLLNGYGFPRYKGGPMWYADREGVDQILAGISQYATTDPLFWRPSPLLIELVSNQGFFSNLNW